MDKQANAEKVEIKINPLETIHVAAVQMNVSSDEYTVINTGQIIHVYGPNVDMFQLPNAAGRLVTDSSFKTLFSKYESDWFCVYDNRYIRQWKGESVSKDKIVPMRRYLDEVFNPDKVINIINRYDMRNFMYCDIMSQALFATQLKLIKAK